MKKIIGIVIGAVLLLFLILGIARTRKSEQALSIAKIQQTEGVPVFAQAVKLGDVKTVRSYYGTVRAKNQANVNATVMDRIDKILVHEGDHVKEGQVVVKCDTTATSVPLAQSRLQYQNARQDYQRTKKLYDDGAVSKQMLDKAELGYRVAKEGYITSKNMLDLIAPISGVVARVDFEEGELAHGGDPVMVIVSDTNFDISFSVTQEDRNLLEKGQKVTVYLDGNKGIEGKITKVGLAAGAQSRLFTAYADIPYGPGIYPGVLATVDVTIQDHQNVVAVPLDAVLDRGEGPFVIVIDNGESHIRKVTLGLRGETVIEIASGLQVGETVATYGQKSLADGAKVKIVQEATAAVD